MWPGRTLAGIPLLAAAAAMAACTTLDVEDETTRINYSLGYQIGGDFDRQGVALDADAVIAGIEDARRGSEPRMSPAEMHRTLAELKQRIVTEQRSRSANAELERLEAGRRFLEQNAGMPGVVTTATGLQYRVIAAGEGRKPGPTDRVTLRYRGTLIDGNEFDSSEHQGSPSSFPLNGVIKAWTEGLQLVREGGRIELFVPPDLAYRDRGPLAHRTLVYDVELISVEQEG